MCLPVWHSVASQACEEQWMICQQMSTVINSHWRESMWGRLARDFETVEDSRSNFTETQLEVHGAEEDELAGAVAAICCYGIAMASTAGVKELERNLKGTWITLNGLPTFIGLHMGKPLWASKSPQYSPVLFASPSELQPARLPESIIWYCPEKSHVHTIVSILFNMFQCSSGVTIKYDAGSRRWSLRPRSLPSWGTNRKVRSERIRGNIRGTYMKDTWNT